MKQVVQPIAGGSAEVLDVPRPTAGPTEVLVRTQASIISVGTEGAITALAQSSLLAKARARALVRRPAPRRPAARRSLPLRGHRPGSHRRRDRGDRLGAGRPGHGRGR
jgi:hypothetical protein